ncbi:MAG TPA: maleylpyruvate isomerase family mycothiol-dependent enzyme [Acidimicrobiales bacterium]|nr:maleylpyruvate isomerase family mycothiol-dependent enzyme [Acidimicrobiales bacterium]
MGDVFDDLRAEQDRLSALLSGLDADSWAMASGAPGWSVADVVLHLAQSEELVVASVSAGAGAGAFGDDATSVDEAMEQLVRQERAEPVAVLERWEKGRHLALAALRSADPDVALSWAATPLRPRTLATTRLAEHWAHGLDITGPLHLDFPDTDRLQHIAWLGHRTLAYAFDLAGEERHEVRCELTGPDGDRWVMGPAGADTLISGPAGDFARVGARRLAPKDSRLVAEGPHGPLVLRLLRNYAA